MGQKPSTRQYSFAADAVSGSLAVGRAEELTASALLLPPPPPLKTTAIYDGAPLIARHLNNRVFFELSFLFPEGQSINCFYWGCHRLSWHAGLEL